MSSVAGHRDDAGSFVEAVVARAERVGPQAALAMAARSLAGAAGIVLDEQSLRLFVDEVPKGAAPGTIAGEGISPEADAGRASATPSVRSRPSAPPQIAARSAPTDTAANENSALADAALLGTCMEALLTAGQRVAGAHHTPVAVAERVAALALGAAGPGPSTPPATHDGGVANAGPSSEAPGRAVPDSVCDPAVGGGVFLLVTAEWLHRQGLSRTETLRRLWGFDTDPLAVAVTEAALALWAGAASTTSVERLIVGDFLDRDVPDHRPPPGWSVIVGNPPFQSQLAGRTARDRDRADRLRHRFGSSAGGYVDEAGLFVLAGAQHLAPRGRLALILPASLLAADSSAELRSVVSARAPIEAIWVPPRQVFAASVDVVVPVLERAGSDRAGREVTVHAGGRGRGGTAADPEDADPAVVLTVPDPGSAWSTLLADAEGVPRVGFESDPGVVGDRAGVTAGFRQQFYGLAGAVAEGCPTDGRPLLTVGLVDPLTSRWGRRSTRLAGTAYRSPVVDTAAIEDTAVAEWVRDRQRPKVLIATQSRVVEAVVDTGGDMIPSTPLISVEPADPETDLWRLAAVLCAPPVTAWFHRRAAGGGLSKGRIRPTAALVREVPLPGDESAWARGAALAEEASAIEGPDGRRACLLELGSVMSGAYGASPPVTGWWADLLPSP